MIVPRVPDPDSALQKIVPLAPILYDAFEAAVQQAREFFDSRNLAVDPWLFANLVRFFVKQSLAGSGHDVEYDLDDLANSGLRFAFEDWDIRILKAAWITVNGESHRTLPTPGKSEAKQEFYQQQLAFHENAVGQLRAITLNVVILWDVTSGWNFSGLFLACPKNGGNYRASVETFWPIAQIPVPLPVATEQAEQQPDDLNELGSAPTPTGTDQEHD